VDLPACVDAGAAPTAVRRHGVDWENRQPTQRTVGWQAAVAGCFSFSISCPQNHFFERYGQHFLANSINSPSFTWDRAWANTTYGLGVSFSKLCGVELIEGTASHGSQNLERNTERDAALYSI